MNLIDGALEWVITLGAVVVVLIGLGGAWLLVRGSYNQARVKALREDVEDRDKRIADRDAVIAVHEAKAESLTRELAHCGTEIKLLEELVTQRANVEAVQGAVLDVLTELKKHHRDASAHWENMNDALRTLLGDIGGLES